MLQHPKCEGAMQLAFQLFHGSRKLKSRVLRSEIWVANNAERHDRFIEQGRDYGDKSSTYRNAHRVQTRNKENDTLQAAEQKESFITYKIKSILNNTRFDSTVCIW
jgi:hypothetical protein